MTKTNKIFILDSKKAFKQAERFKRRLENEGYMVITKAHGFNGVKISAKKKLRRCV